jgi:hypothetical protein
MRGTSIGARWARIGLACMALGLQSGCGTYVPALQENGFDEGGGKELEAAIVQSVHCELFGAVAAIFIADAQQPQRTEPLADFLQGWSVQMTLTLTIDEKTTLNPNIFASFLPGLFTLGAAGTASTLATRIDKLNYYYSIQDLLKHGKCSNEFIKKIPAKGGSLLMRSDLKTREWLESQVLNQFAGEFVPTKNGFQHEVTFVLDTSVSVTPGAKFPTITLMPSGTLFMGERMRTHDLILTFGPASDDDKSKQQLAPAAQAMFLSSQISSGLRTGALLVSP